MRSSSGYRVIRRNVAFSAHLLRMCPGRLCTGFLLMRQEVRAMFNNDDQFYRSMPSTCQHRLALWPVWRSVECFENRFEDLCPDWGHWVNHGKMVRAVDLLHLDVMIASVRGVRAVVFGERRRHDVV